MVVFFDSRTTTTWRLVCGEDADHMYVHRI